MKTSLEQRQDTRESGTPSAGAQGTDLPADPGGSDVNYARRQDENTDRFRAIFDTAGDAIIVIDQLGLIGAFNRAAETIFGYVAEEVIGRNVKLLMPEAHPGKRDGNAGERKIIGIGRETVGLRKDGVAVPLEVSIAEWLDADRRSCFTGILRDATQRNLQARRLRESTEIAHRARIEAEGANEAKTEFLAVMSHEIRTPLTSIGGFMDLLKHTVGLNSQQRRYVDLVQTAQSALLAIVDDILDFSKAEAGGTQLEPRPFRPSALIEDAMNLFGPTASAKSLSLESRVDPNVPEWLMGDQARLRQILLNLLGNAAKFMQKGSIRVDVRAQVSVDGGERIRFSVAHTGIGIPSDRQRRLFETFSQVDGSAGRRHGGAGLGLAICKQLVDLMDGQIGIHGDDEGSTVWFTASLPAINPPKPHSESLALPEDLAGTKARILVVDDIESNREIVEAYLRDGGYEVATVGSAVEAIRIIQSEPFHVVLMDIQMPDMDGVTATRCIRALPTACKNIPIIAMTGNVLPRQVRSFLDAGMNDHVGKPIERAKLYDSVRGWTSKSQDHDVIVTLN